MFPLIKWEVPESPGCKSEWCTKAPDVILGCPFWRACRIHDFAYGGRVPLGRSESLERWKADLLFFRNLIEVTWDHTLRMLSRSVGSRLLHSRK